MKGQYYYRVENIKTGQGLWYDMFGNFTGLIHSEYSFCKNNQLQMPFDERIKGYLSVTLTLDELFEWFPKEDLLRLKEFGYVVTRYKSSDPKFHNGHWLILHETAIVAGIVNIN